MKNTKEEQRIKDFEESLFSAYKEDQSEENKEAIIAYMKTLCPQKVVGWTRYMRIGNVKAVYNYEEKIWQVFVIEEAA